MQSNVQDFNDWRNEASRILEVAAANDQSHHLRVSAGRLRLRIASELGQSLMDSVLHELARWLGPHGEE
ncbi:hypothetical protein O999_10845 [Pseudomonas putida LF54]|nr:hypothetical protein O999_10845 [Pseudomonas putida LF54]